MYTVFLSRHAEKQLAKYPEKIAEHLRSRMRRLAEEAVPSDAKRIIGRKDKVFRIRAGDYRILYTVLEKEVLIVNIDKRERVYHR